MPDGHEMTVALLLEDEPLIALDVQQVLIDAGFEVSTISTCADALEWLQKHRPDVVIVDIILRDGPCHSVVARLVEDDIPFIVHSGDHPRMHADTPFAGGTWIGKPVDGIEMVRAARRLVAA